jgi:diguanylate cyclase (GGDEF)-like protein
VATHAHDGTWLCPTKEDRVRLLDMERRLPPVRMLTWGAVGLSLLLSTPWLGWWPLPLLAVVIVGVIATDRNLGSARQPEYRVMLSWLLSVAAIAYGSLRTEGLHGPLAPWLAIPAVTLGVRFRIRGVIAGTLLTGAVLGAIALATHATHHLHLPSQVWFVADVALVASSVGYTLTLLYSDIQHRDEALIDPLTGMLNRHALEGRIKELAEQARLARQPIALIMGDVDHFKAINDEHGHEAGDAVLQAVGARIRSHLRAYDLAYRLGGEEFLIVLPGSDLAGARLVAERLREAIAHDSALALPFTMSFGVAASTAAGFDFRTLLRETDGALYAAKAAGRNRVQIAGAPPGAEEAGASGPALARGSAGAFDALSGARAERGLLSRGAGRIQSAEPGDAEHPRLDQQVSVS